MRRSSCRAATSGDSAARKRHGEMRSILGKVAGKPRACEQNAGIACRSMIGIKAADYGFDRLDRATHLPQMADQRRGDEGFPDFRSGAGDEYRGHRISALERCRRMISASRAMSPSSCWAVKAKRSLAVPAGTVGGTDRDDQEAGLAQKIDAASAAAVITDDDGHDSALRLRQIERAGKSLRFAQWLGGIGWIALDQLERGDCRGNDRRRQAGRVNESAGAGAHEVNHGSRRAANSRHRRRRPSTAFPLAAVHQ